MAKTELDVGPSARFLVFPILIALALAFIGYAILQGAPQHFSLISISASGSASAVPTQASIYLYLNGTGSTAAIAQSNLSSASTALNTTLSPFLEGNESNIQTQSYSLYPASNCTPAYYPYPTTTTICPSSNKFYVATETILVTLPSVSSVDSALSRISRIKGISIGSVSAKLSAQQQSGLQQQALSTAITNATNQADALANGRQVVVQNITVQNGYIFYPNAGVFSGASIAANQTFFTGQATVTKNIYVVFSMH
ncbi:MAG: SIMPL domain-containing protein [Candidatus Micrarchaeota archaeon]|nr:SIMPL domain-containing protein [Candidatus Micrarchaeota archaeon]